MPPGFTADNECTALSTTAAPILCRCSHKLDGQPVLLSRNDQLYKLCLSLPPASLSSNFSDVTYACSNRFEFEFEFFESAAPTLRFHNQSSLSCGAGAVLERVDKFSFPKKGMAPRFPTIILTGEERKMLKAVKPPGGELQI